MAGWNRDDFLSAGGGADVFAFVFDPGSEDVIYGYDPNEDSVWLDPKFTAVTGRNEDTNNDGTIDQAVVTLARYGQTQEVVVKGREWWEIEGEFVV